MRDTIVFRKYRYVSCLPDNFTKEELEKEFIRISLERGYIPKITGYIQIRDNFNIRYEDRVYGYEAYIGKKQAPIFYKNNLDVINQPCDKINIYLTNNYKRI